MTTLIVEARDERDRVNAVMEKCALVGIWQIESKWIDLDVKDGGKSIIICSRLMNNKEGVIDV